MRKLIVFAAVAVAFALGAAPASADVRVTMRDGRVTVVAKDATLRQILAEWARVGQARIVNGEQVAGGPITIELTDLPERQALDILMRSVGGYFAAPRPTALPNAAFYDRIIVLPAAAPRSTSVSNSAPAPLPQPRFQPNPVDDDAAFQRAPFAPPTPQPAGAAMPVTAAPQLTPAPAFQPGPPIQPGAPPASAPIAPAASGPLGSSRPGVIAAPPQQPPQANQPGRP